MINCNRCTSLTNFATQATAADTTATIQNDVAIADSPTQIVY